MGWLWKIENGSKQSKEQCAITRENQNYFVSHEYPPLINIDEK